MHIAQTMSDVAPFAHFFDDASRDARVAQQNQNRQQPADVQAALDVIESNEGVFRKDFADWLVDNWPIWVRFVAEADAIWDTGRRHYSARTLIEFIRHETNLREVNSTFKVNNSYVPDGGRLYGLLYPDRKDFFECREMSQECVRRKIRGSVRTSAEDFGDRVFMVGMPTPAVLRHDDAEGVDEAIAHARRGTYRVIPGKRMSPSLMVVSSVLMAAAPLREAA